MIQRTSNTESKARKTTSNIPDLEQCFPKAVEEGFETQGVPLGRKIVPFCNGVV
jgi:hypothetical protein